MKINKTEPSELNILPSMHSILEGLNSSKVCIFDNPTLNREFTYLMRETHVLC